MSEEAARSDHQSLGATLNAWVAALRSELGLDVDLDVPQILDVARVSAHRVARPAAPLTTFLIGYAAGAAGSDRTAAASAAERARELAQRWEDPGE